MAVIYGHIGQFEEKNETFTDYAGRCAAFMAANDIANDRRVNLFLATVGPATYKLLKNLCDPQNPNIQTYAQLINLLTNHYEPTPIIIAERHKFWTASQEESESVSDFAVRLKFLASTCAFGGFLLEALRDRVVSGLHSKMSHTQRRLLAMRDLTFQQARERCVADELAGKANKEHMGEATNKEHMGEATHKVSSSYPKRFGGRYQGKSQGRKGPTPTSSQQDSGDSTMCMSCGSSKHARASCKFRDAVCHHCNRKGHIKSVCQTRLQNKDKTVNCVDSGSESEDEVYNSYHVQEGAVSDPNTEGFGLYRTDTEVSVERRKHVIAPYTVTVNIGKARVIMEIDTGATRSTVSEQVYRSKLSEYKLRNAGIILRSYSGEKVPLLGKITVPVIYGKGPEKMLELIVVQGPRPALLGRDWLQQITLEWDTIFALTEDNVEVPTSKDFPDEFNELLNENKVLFATTGSGIKGFCAKLELKPGAQPVFQKHRQVPYSLVSAVEDEYSRLVKSDIWYPVTHSQWASPVVHVPKANGRIRVCGDYKALNERIEDDGYKLPNVQDMFAMLSSHEGTPSLYSVIDLSGAFNQLFLTEESSKLVALNTRRGLFSTKRLCFGIKTAPVQFQRVMDQIVMGIKGVVVRVDDILVATKGSITEHLHILKQLFGRLAKHNVQLNGSKCQFFVKRVKYMGHILSAEGISPIQDKLEAIRRASRPTEVPEVRTFLGMINYYAKFVENLSSKMHPLFALLKKDVGWNWSAECEEAFSYAKEVLSSDRVLVHYDPSKELVLGVDASPYGIGAVLSHRMADGSERPIEYASRTLSSAEKGYAQIEKEALAIIFGIKKFNLYLYGRKFILVTDHKPLTRIFGPKSNIPPLAAARMQRWAIFLTGYSFDIIFRKSEDNANADYFSRFPIPNQREAEVDGDEYYVFSTLVDQLPVTAREIASCLRTDKVLARAYENTSSGWSDNSVDAELKPYWIRREELSLEDGCLLWGRRVIIPSVLQDRLLNELHECHPGMSRMKALARSFVWWPDIDSDIEDRVRGCEECIKALGSPKAVPLLLWPWSTEPWQRVHVDFAEIKGQQYLLVVDSHSKWLEVFPMASTTAECTIEVMRSLFSRYGLPLEVVSDNGPQFRAELFKGFLQQNGVKQTLCPPYHPASNGLAERHVQTFKRMYAKYGGDRSVQHKVSDVLFHYRNTPHTTTDKTPAELFLKRSPRTPLSLVKPSLQSRVEKKQVASKYYTDGLHPRPRAFDLYQSVRVRNVRGGKERWIPGTIVEIRGPETYIVRVPGNSRRYVHANHLIPDDTSRGDSTSTQGVEATGIGAGIGGPGVNVEMREANIPVASPNSIPSRPPIPLVEMSPEPRPASPGLENKSPGGFDGAPSPLHGPLPDVSITSPQPGTPVRVTRSGRIVNPPKRLDM